MTSLAHFTDAVPQDSVSSTSHSCPSKTSGQCDENVLQNLCQQSFAITEHDYSEFDFGINSNGKELQKKNVLSYIGGFIARKLKQQHGKYCDSCIAKVVSNSSTSPEYQLINLKQHSGCRIGLHYPSPFLVTLIAEAEEVYCKLAREIIYMGNVKQKLVSFLLARCVDFSLLSCLECNVSKDVAHVYSTIRLHHSLKLVNQELCQTKMTRCRKLMKISHL